MMMKKIAQFRSESRIAGKHLKELKKNEMKRFYEKINIYSTEQMIKNA